MFKTTLLLTLCIIVYANLGAEDEKTIEEDNSIVDDWLSKECNKRKTRSAETKSSHFSPLLSRSILPECMPLFQMFLQPPYNVISITPVQLVPLKVRVTIRVPQTNELLSTEGMVCDDSFDQSAALAVCRSMGKTRAAYLDSVQWTADRSCKFEHRNQIQTNQCQFILDDVQCSGTATNLNQCRRSEIFTHNCGSSEHVSVICS